MNLLSTWHTHLALEPIHYELELDDICRDRDDKSNGRQILRLHQFFTNCNLWIRT